MLTCFKLFAEPVFPCFVSRPRKMVHWCWLWSLHTGTCCLLEPGLRCPDTAAARILICLPQQTWNSLPLFELSGTSTAPFLPQHILYGHVAVISLLRNANRPFTITTTLSCHTSRDSVTSWQSFFLPCSLTLHWEEPPEAAMLRVGPWWLTPAKDQEQEQGTDRAWLMETFLGL